MADSPDNHLDQISTGQTGKERKANEVFDSASPSTFGARRASTTAGLTVGFYGGKLSVNGVDTPFPASGTGQVGTASVTGSATRYLECSRSGTFSVVSTPTPGAIRLATMVTSGSAITNYTDDRCFVPLGNYNIVQRASAISVTSADVTLTEAQARCKQLATTGTLTGNRNLIVPNGPQEFTVTNGCSGAFNLTVKTAAGTGVIVAQSTTAYLQSDGTNVVSIEAAAASIADNSVTNAKLADVSTQTIKGRTSASTGDPEDLTGAQAAAIVQGDGLTVDMAGFRGIPQNAQTGNYTLVAADAGKHIYHASGAGSGDTYTIPANGSVAFPIGTTVTFVNEDSNSVSIAITTDTMHLGGSGATGTRTLAQYGVATALKLTSTLWIISGPGLT